MAASVSPAEISRTVPTRVTGPIVENNHRRDPAFDVWFGAPTAVLITRAKAISIAAGWTYTSCPTMVAGPERLRQRSMEHDAPVMKAIDSVLKILVEQGATELRLMSERRPQMFKDKAELPLTFPAMSAARIRELLENLWTDHQAEL